MAANYYDDALVQKISAWLPQTPKTRVLKPDETDRLFQTIADDLNDKPLSLPLIAISRSKDLEILTNTKTAKSYDGYRIAGDRNNSGTFLLNVIPIKLTYQLDIYTKTYEQGDEYLRNFLFLLINNPKIIIDIPYSRNAMLNNDSVSNSNKDDVEYLQHIANIRVLSQVSDNSDIKQHLFSGQFTRWTIQLEIQDAMLFSIPYKKNWVFEETDLEVKFRSDAETEIIY